MTGEWSLGIRNDDGQSGGGQWGRMAGFRHRNLWESGRRISVLGTGRTILGTPSGLAGAEAVLPRTQIGCAGGTRERAGAATIVLQQRSEEGRCAEHDVDLSGSKGPRLPPFWVREIWARGY
jgi:hypothetical protein